MKKTIIALMALAGVAAADQDFVIPTASNFYAGNYTFDFLINKNDVIYDDTHQITGLTNGNVLALYYGTFSGDEHYSNGAIFTVSEGVITLSIGRAGSLANAWNAATSTPILKSDTSFTISSDGQSGGMFVDSSSKPITIEIGKTYTITNTVDTRQNNNQSVSLWVEGKDEALATVKYKGNMSGGNENTVITSVLNATYTVPEPTTATLSLLALAGLAARRRRK